MFYGSREKCLAVLKLIGRESCCYGGPWPDNICDCKYGVQSTSMFPESMHLSSGTQDIRVRSVTGEQTGCPEVRSIYRVIEAMSDEEWQALCDRPR